MRAAFAIAKSVIVAQRATLGAAAACVVILLVVRLGWPEERATLFAWRVPLTAGALLGAFLVGMSLVGEELASGRAAFWFARPISAWSIWGGKLGGAMVVAVALQAAVLAPTDGTGPRGIIAVDNAVEMAAWLTVLSVAGGMLSGVLTRGRSRMAWVNWAGIVGVVALGVHEIGRIEAVSPRSWPGKLTPQMDALLRQLDARVDILGVVVVLGATLACLAGSAAATVAGRTSPARAHAAASTAAWAIAAPAAVAVLVLGLGLRLH